MKKIRLMIFLMLGASLYGNSQVDSVVTGVTLEEVTITPILLDQYYFGSAVVLESELGFNSNGLNNQFYRSIYYSEKITQEIKDNASSSLSNSNNCFGGDFWQGLRYNGLINRKEKKLLPFYVSLRNVSHINMGFSENLFHSIFYGNQDFKGLQTNMEAFSYLNLRYQKLGVGLFTNCSKAIYGGAINFLFGNRVWEAKADRFIVYTEEDGRYLDIDLKGEINRADTASKNYFDMNGMGGSIDLYANFKIRKGSISIQVQDLGGIGWRDQSLRFTTDSLYRFEGVDLNNIINFKDSIYWDQIREEVNDEYSFNFRKERMITMLPAWIRLQYGKFLNENKALFESGIFYRINANYIPYAYASIKGTGKNINVGGRLAYGGYGKLAIGANVEIKFTQCMYFLLQTNNLEGFILPKQYSGISLLGALQYRIK